jgi:hypothetical protein
MALIDVQAEEVEQAVPALVKALLVTNPEDRESVEMKEKSKQVLAKIGKPAVKALVKALESDFTGGGARTPAGLIKAAARLEVLNTLALIGPKGKTTELMQALARTERGDPVSDIRVAAKQLRLLINK